MSNLVEILVTAKDLTGPAMASVNAKVNGASAGMAKFHKTAMLAGAGFAAIGYESVKMASRFDSDMALLQTQAGVSADKIAGLKKGVLGLAGKVGQDPDSLAEALFHVESNFASMGISSARALKLTETAAKGATVGHADLVDVTNALTAAVASGIPGVENLDQAMGVLNATVGSGDMKMQDLANAFGSGMVATVKGFGLNITDVGAALATFGDNNIRGALAGNQLRMSVMALAKPVAGGAKTLESLGLQADTLAKDMQKGGLKLALEDLVAHMKAAGVSSAEQGQIITEAFGRKAGAGLNILVGQMDRLESKYPEITKGAKTFSQSWEDTKKTFAFQMKSMQTGFEALMIGLGQKIIPPLQSFIHFLGEHKRASLDSAQAMVGLLAGVVAVSAALKVAAGVKLLWSGVTTGAVLAKGAFEAVALKAMYMRDASVAAGGGVRGLGAAFGTLSRGAKLGVTVAAIGGLVVAVKALSDIGKAAPPNVDRMTTALGELGRTGKASGELTRVYGDNLKSLSGAFDLMSKGASNNGAIQFLDKLGSGFGLFGKGDIQSAKDKINDFDDALAGLVSSGHADMANKALDRLAASGKHIDPKKLDDYNAALAGTKLQSDLVADAQGKFGKQAQKVQAQLDVQAQSAKGLMDSLQALDQVNQDAYNGETRLYDAMAAGADIAKKKGASLNLNTDAGRRARDAMTAIAVATDSATAAFAKQSSSWGKVNAAYAKGHDALVADAMQMGKNRDQANAYADSLLHIPKEVKIKGDVGDIESKIKRLEKDLKTASKSKTAKIKADITDAEKKLVSYKWQLAQLTDKDVHITTFLKSVYSGPLLGGQKRAAGGPVVGPGSGTSDDVPIMASNGEFVVNAAATSRHRGLLEAINSGADGYARGGRVMPAHTRADQVKARAERVQAAAERRQAALDAERQAGGEALGQLGMSHFGRMAGFSMPAFVKGVGAPGDVGGLVATLNEWRSKIRAATHGALEGRLTGALDRFGAAAIRNEKALTAVNARLDAAKDKLAGLKAAFAQMRDSIASSVVSFGSIARQGGGGPLGQVSVGEQLRQSVGQAQAFAQDLAVLKKKGLNSQSLSEIASAGIEGGGLETAQRLLGASKADIKQINSLEKQLQAAGKAAGQTTADAMYGGGLRAADALVKGLEKSQTRIEKVMERAALSMAAALKGALSHKATGGVVGAAATGGPRWGRTLVGEYGPEIADLPVGSRIHSAPDTQRMLSASGGGQVPPIEITLMIGDTALGTVMVDPLRRVIRDRGGNVQAVLGVRGK